MHIGHRCCSSTACCDMRHMCACGSSGWWWPQSVWIGAGYAITGVRGCILCTPCVCSCGCMQRRRDPDTWLVCIRSGRSCHLGQCSCLRCVWIGGATASTDFWRLECALVRPCTQNCPPHIGVGCVVVLTITRTVPSGVERFILSCPRRGSEYCCERNSSARRRRRVFTRRLSMPRECDRTEVGVFRLPSLIVTTLAL